MIPKPLFLDHQDKRRCQRKPTQPRPEPRAHNLFPLTLLMPAPECEAGQCAPGAAIWTGNMALPSPRNCPDLHPPWPCPIAVALQSKAGGEIILAFLGSWGNLGRHRWTSASGSSLPPPHAAPQLLIASFSGLAGCCGSSSRTAASVRPASLEAERPLPPNPRNRLKGAQGRSRGANRGWSGFTNQKSKAGAQEGLRDDSPSDSIGISPHPSFLPLPNTQHSVPWGFYSLPSPRACDPWAERRYFCLLGNLAQHLLHGGPELDWTHLFGFACIFYQEHMHWSSGSLHHHSHQLTGQIHSQSSRPNPISSLW